jgi:hypothetical protein
MVVRYQVVRGKVFHRKKVYDVGEFLPTDFTDRDRARNVYSRRIIKVELNDSKEPEKIVEVVPNPNMNKEEIPNTSELKDKEVVTKAPTVITTETNSKVSPIVKKVWKDPDVKEIAKKPWASNKPKNNK